MTQPPPDSKIYTILIISTFRFLHVVGTNSFCISAVIERDYPPRFDPTTPICENLHDPDYQYVPISACGMGKELLRQCHEAVKLPPMICSNHPYMRKSVCAGIQHITISACGMGKELLCSVARQPDYPCDLIQAPQMRESARS